MGPLFNVVEKGVDDLDGNVSIETLVMGYQWPSGTETAASNLLDPQ
jgi:hypothetical protein